MNKEITVSTHEIPIHRALAAVMADVRAVGKDDHNQQQGFSFRGIDATLNSVGPVLRTHGVVLLPTVEQREESEVATKSGGRSIRVVLELRVTFIGPAGDTLDVRVPGEAMDSGDKAYSKAVSVGMRTALLHTLALPTHDRDPDHDVYERADQPAPTVDWDGDREALAGDADGLLQLYYYAQQAGADSAVLERIKRDGTAARATQNGGGGNE